MSFSRNVLNMKSVHGMNFPANGLALLYSFFR